MIIGMAERQIARSQDRINTLDWYSGMSALLGLVGFVFWYRNVQRHHDVVLQREATSDVRDT